MSTHLTQNSSHLGAKEPRNFKDKILADLHLRPLEASLLDFRWHCAQSQASVRPHRTYDIVSLYCTLVKGDSRGYG